MRIAKLICRGGKWITYLDKSCEVQEIHGASLLWIVKSKENFDKMVELHSNNCGILVSTSALEPFAECICNLPCHVHR